MLRPIILSNFFSPFLCQRYLAGRRTGLACQVSKEFKADQYKGAWEFDIDTFLDKAYEQASNCSIIKSAVENMPIDDPGSKKSWLFFVFNERTSVECDRKIKDYQKPEIDLRFRKLDV